MGRKESRVAGKGAQSSPRELHDKLQQQPVAGRAVRVERDGGAAWWKSSGSVNKIRNLKRRDKEAEGVRVGAGSHHQRVVKQPSFTLADAPNPEIRQYKCAAASLPSRGRDPKSSGHGSCFHTPGQKWVCPLRSQVKSKALLTFMQGAPFWVW